jgi:hypothetical protein
LEDIYRDVGKEIISSGKKKKVLKEEIPAGWKHGRICKTLTEFNVEKMKKSLVLTQLLI